VDNLGINPPEKVFDRRKLVWPILLSTILYFFIVFTIPWCKDNPRSSSESTLSRSSKTGLLGVVLPKGAKLSERVKGDPARDTDPRERYRIEVSFQQIRSFFEQEMPRFTKSGAGWKLGLPHNSDVLFFDRASKRIAILINKKGGSFTLMGS